MRVFIYHHAVRTQSKCPKLVTQAGSQQGNRGVRAANWRLMAAHLRVSVASLQMDAFNLQWARNSGVNDSVSAICSL